MKQEDEFSRRFSAAKAHRSEYMEETAREIYKFCFNGREREWDGAKNRTDYDADEIFADLIPTVAEEFHGELYSTMTPENTPWVAFEAGNAIDEEIASEAEAELLEFERAIAKSIRTSNYYQEGPSAFQDSVVGTQAMWVERKGLGQPINCKALPLSKCFFMLGPNGLEDRFYRESYYYRDLPALFPRAQFSKKLRDKIDKAKTGRAVVVWGFWRDYKDPLAPQWVHQIRVDNESIGLDEDLGFEGACPIVAGRFNPIPGSAYGRGPGVRMLPSMRVLDELSRMVLEGMDRALDPAFSYVHDGLTDLSDGIESGMGYPRMPGADNSIEPIALAGNLDYGFFSQERLEMQIRYGFYREPEQRGKTPPSATQYMGEEQKQLRRMARPAGPLWGEFVVGLLKRFEFIEREDGGSLQDQRLPLIESGVVIPRPISPLERAQAREDVITAQSIMEIANQNLGPEQAALLIDGPATFGNIKSSLKDQIVQVRTPEQIRQIIQETQATQNAPQNQEGGQ